MAEKRMFTQKIVDSDAFLDMPLSSQALYFHLNMRADDDGFVNNPKRIQRTIGASEDDLKLLIAKRFLLCFENGVVVIKHWRMHNLLRKDRYNPTVYVEEMQSLELKENGTYTEREFDVPQLPENSVATTWQPNGNQMAHRIGKDSKVKESIVEDSEGQDSEDEICHVITLFNSICVSFPSVKVLNDSRKTELTNRLSMYTIDDFKTLFEKVEASKFLKGQNRKNWSATFDWLIKDENMLKVLEGNYDNKIDPSKSYETEAIEQAIIKRMTDPPKTAAEDENIRARAEALKQQFANS